MRTWHKYSYAQWLSWHSLSCRREQAQLCWIICRLGWAQSQPQKTAQLLFLRCLCPESSHHRFPLFLNSYNVMPPENCYSTSLFALYVINSLEVDAAVVCLCQSTQLTWPQHFCMFVFCLLSFLNLPSLPVRFLG
jgi:hypothetical protein